MSTDTPMVGAPEYTYRGADLHCEGASLAEIARRTGTPTFVYSSASIDQAYRVCDEALEPWPHLVAYAVKANSNLAVLAQLATAGAGADIVSGGELARCLTAGFAPERIVFSGVGKRDAEIGECLRVGIRSLHVECEPEIDAIEEIATRMGVNAPIALRINPDVDAKSHPYIATGLHHTKFGLELDVARRLLPRIVASEHLRLEGVTCHVGSQISTPAPLGDAVAITARFALECVAAGATIRSLDAGGGWPISYGDETDPFPPARAYGQAIGAAIEEVGAGDLGLELIVEPGRALVGNAGVLLTEVLFVKEQHGKRFIIVDAAMNDLIRPALYQAHHRIAPLRKPTDGSLAPADVVGPVCETGDFLAQGRDMPELARGDLLAVFSAGAYGMVMSSQYNARPRAAEVLVEGSAFRTIRSRERMEDLLRGEQI